MMSNQYKYDDSTGSWIAKDFIQGNNFKHALNCIIEPDVVVGDDVTIGHNVHLKAGTRILNDVDIADHCMTTGICFIGNHVRIRTGSCISKSVIIDDYAFIAAGIMSSHTKHIFHGRPKMQKHQFTTRIGYGAIIGSRANLMAGVLISPGVIVGYNANVVGNLDVPHGIYINKPHSYATLQKQLDADDPWYIEVPEDYTPHQFDNDLLGKYLPYFD